MVLNTALTPEQAEKDRNESKKAVKKQEEGITVQSDLQLLALRPDQRAALQATPLSPAFGSGTYDPRIAHRQPETTALDYQELVLQHQLSYGRDSSQAFEDLPNGSDSHAEALTTEPAAASQAGHRLLRRSKAKDGAAAGPCDHCGRKHSPAWRKGPPHAPRLCNACGTHFAHRKSLDGYLPGMKQRDEERLVKLLRTRSPMPEEMGSGAEAQAAQESDSPQASRPSTAEEAAPCHTVWTSFVDQARAQRDDWRAVARLLQAAIDAAQQSPDLHERNMAPELERAQRLFWTDRDAAMSLLDELSDVEVLFALNTERREQVGEGTSDAFASSPVSAPTWQSFLQQINISSESMSVERLLALVSASLQAGIADSSMDALLLAKLQAVYEVLAPEPTAASKLAALKLLADIQPSWGHCEACGKRRLARRELRPWESFTCGSAIALMPDRNCDSLEDVAEDWHPPRLSLEAGNVLPLRQAKGKKRSAETAALLTPNLDALAQAAEEVAEIPTEERVSSFRRQPRTKRSRHSTGAVLLQAGLEQLPVGWQLTTVLTNTTGGISTIETAYTCPNTARRFSSLADALAHAEGSNIWKARQKDKPPMKLEVTAGLPAREHAPSIKQKPQSNTPSRRLPHVQTADLAQASTQTPAPRPPSKPTRNEVQGTNCNAAVALASMHSFKEWNAAQQKPAHSLADVIRCANEAACHPTAPGQPLHKHSSAPGNTAMARQFKSKDPQPGPEPLARSRSEAAMLPSTSTEDEDLVGSRGQRVEEEVSRSKTVPASKDRQARSSRASPAATAAGGTSPSQEPLQPPPPPPQSQGAFVIRMAKNDSQSPRSFDAAPIAVTSGPMEVPTIRIVTSNPALPPSFVPPIAFPGFSRGFSTVTTAVGLDRRPGNPAAEPTPNQANPPQSTAAKELNAGAPQTLQRAESGRRKRGRKARTSLPASLLPPTPSLRDLPSDTLQPAHLPSPARQDVEHGKGAVPPLFWQPPPVHADSAAATSGALPVFAVPERSQQLGRAISDPQVLKRELENGLHALEDIAEEGGSMLTMEQQWQLLSLQQNSPGNAFMPIRPLGRAISDPQSVQSRLAEALGSTTGYLPSGTSLVTWQAAVRLLPPRDDMESLELFSLVAALPVRLASTLPSEIPVSQFKPRSQIYMAAVADKPLLLRLGPVDERQRGAVIQMEELKLAAVARLDGFDLALIPHINSRNSLHIVGLKMDQAARLELERSTPASPPPRSSSTAPLSKNPPVDDKAGSNGSNRTLEGKVNSHKASIVKARSAQNALDKDVPTREPRRKSKGAAAAASG